VSPKPRRTAGWRQHVKAAFTQNIVLKAIAVLVAVMLWFLVDTREPKEDLVRVRFDPQLDTSLVLRDPAPLVIAKVFGSVTELQKLANTPLVIRKTIAGDAPDTLVLELRTSDVVVPEGVELIVREVEPRFLTLRFESTVTRMVPVRSAIIVRAPAGVSNVPVRIEPESVTVRGPRRVVTRIVAITTVHDSVTIDTLPHLIDLDTAGLGVSVRPPQVKAILGRARP
jgi:hypothetical protein